MRDHTKLRTFELADELAIAVHSEAEYLHFLDMAYGSAREVEYQIPPG